MALTITIRTDSAAFGPDLEKKGADYEDGNEPTYECRREVAELLRGIAQAIEDGCTSTHHQTILDSNGNDVGRWRLLQDPI